MPYVLRINSFERYPVWNSPTASRNERTFISKKLHRDTSIRIKNGQSFFASGNEGDDNILSSATPTMQVWLDMSRSNLNTNNNHRLNEADAMIISCDNDDDDNSYTVALSFDGSKDVYIKKGNKLFRNNSQQVQGTVIDSTKNQNSSPSWQDDAMSLIGSVPWIYIRPATTQPDDEAAVNTNDEWIMIPAENLIASSRDTGTKIAFFVCQTENVLGLSRALELGVDALVVPAHAPNDVWEAAIHARSDRSTAVRVPSSSVAAAGHEPTIVVGSCRRLPTKSTSATAATTTTVLAERVCVDLVQTLSPTEGCWVGSSAKILTLVLSESEPSSYVPTRPFRVNAGPVHSYVLMGDRSTTKYLCEVEAGEEVAVYDCRTGGWRGVAVGRLKVELRPCVMVGLYPLSTGLEVGSRRQLVDAAGQVFLQQAETVRFGQEGGSFVRVTDLGMASSNPSFPDAMVKGEEEEEVNVLLRLSGSGTHVGKSYVGQVTER
eukprot:CAMPEP_0172514270 /NCGR_PEP_ID=MMETSP1066-20121228/258809_1 /TAXON_ID=671091 /ORGANISM="Coscinodiscus wailesii, Strain CCMP2513" /LENGTH=489 /DNA_ID=CAMNT_0013294875 /DNA_START=215 /DNA_END=1684 /DNA_ORIENTATION=+